MVSLLLSLSVSIATWAQCLIASGGKLLPPQRR